MLFAASIDTAFFFSEKQVLTSSKLDRVTFVPRVSLAPVYKMQKVGRPGDEAKMEHDDSEL